MADDRTSPQSNRFLVKGASAALGLQPAVATLRGRTVTLSPLDPGAPAAAMGLAPVSPSDVWSIATVAPSTSLTIEGVNKWELAHELHRTLGGQAGATGLIVEPDLRQDMPIWRKPEEGLGFAPASVEAWHLGPDFSQLERARNAVPDTAQKKVIVAHLDTGYDPDHILAPRNIAKAQERNFEDEDPARRNSAVEPPHAGALVRNFGHGTGTLGILAGGTVPSVGLNIVLGGAPSVTVVPIRVANFVAQFWSSSITAGLNHARRIGAHVVTMSLGGLPSSAWADAVNACYEAGIVVVAAAGNNFSGFPVRDMVWPARFRRVIGVCGIMKDQRPYVDLGGKMEGNFGPASAMDTAMAAYTPEIPWAIIGTKDRVDQDGAGTSAATPQVAAAAALWIAQNFEDWIKLGEGWQRVEAVRRALYESAHQGEKTFLGRGVLQASAALDFKLAQSEQLRMEERDTASFAFLRALTGFGATADPRDAMLRTEATQIAIRSAALRQLIPDPDATGTANTRKFAETLLDAEEMSKDLRQWLSGLAGRRFVQGGGPTPGRGEPVAAPAQVAPAQPPVTEPARHMTPARDVPSVRRLRVFATDPAQALELKRFNLATATITIPWDETIQPGPIGEYVEVVDIDPASHRFYRPVDLNDGNIVAQDGLAPSLDDPRFHQQMTYSVAMRVVDRFERALGRRVLWQAEYEYWRNPAESPPPQSAASSDTWADIRSKGKLEDLTAVQRERLERGFVRRLRIYPHAIRGKNAYYSPQKVALLFGYFRGLRPMPENTPPQAGDMVFTCLSFDVIAHETTHAVLDGINRRLREATNPDVLAFHEALADIVALFERFSLMDLLRWEITEAKGRLGATRLGELAREFGQAMGYGRALRDAINQDPKEYNYITANEAHDRGAVLVAAVFDAFLHIYERRIEPLTSLLPLPQGSRPIHPTAVEMLANEARKAAEHVLTICLRAIDYMPPVDIRFSDFLRALITADMEVEPDDVHGYRVAFIEAFRRRYIFADSIKATSVDSLRWRAPDEQIEGFSSIIRSLDLRWDRSADRLDVYASSKLAGAKLHGWISELDPEKARILGVELANGEKFEVSSIRTIQRVTPAGRIHKDVILMITQRREIPDAEGNGNILFRSGSTIIVSADDNSRAPIRYIISKSPDSKIRQQWTRSYLAKVADGRELYFDESDSSADREPFAMLHAHG